MSADPWYCVIAIVRILKTYIVFEGNLIPQWAGSTIPSASIVRGGINARGGIKPWG